ncbi:MAG: hypothetical protein ACLP8B_21520, partial [Xanthobacteraceae bacterium]
MPGLVPGIHVFTAFATRKTWMAGTSPAMTPIDAFERLLQPPVNARRSFGRALKTMVRQARHAQPENETGGREAARSE